MGVFQCKSISDAGCGKGSKSHVQSHIIYWVGHHFGRVCIILIPLIFGVVGSYVVRIIV